MTSSKGSNHLRGKMPTLNNLPLSIENRKMVWPPSKETTDSKTSSNNPYFGPDCVSYLSQVLPIKAS
ncbi:MAG TPA: hypothetical protein VH796_03010 [Nitrososphaeraceae archaeon]